MFNTGSEPRTTHHSLGRIGVFSSRSSRQAFPKLLGMDETASAAMRLPTTPAGADSLDTQCFRGTQTSGPRERPSGCDETIQGR